MKSFKKKIEESNQAFLDASPEQKRVIIAQDVIDRIKLELLIARDSVFFLYGNQDWRNGSFERPDGSRSFQDIVNEPDESCEVCAKGALFCSYVGRVNKANFDEIVDAQRYPNERGSFGNQKLLEIFTLEQIDLIETAFEGASFLGTGVENAKDAEEFYENSSYNNKDRLVKIMENIIKNNGTFVP